MTSPPWERKSGSDSIIGDLLIWQRGNVSQWFSEHIKDLYDLSVRNFASDVKNSEDGESIKERVEIHHCDGRLGWPSDSTEESYDVIHVGAAAPGLR